MGLKVRQHPNGWWMVDVRVRLASGKVVRDRKKAPGSTRAAAERWGEKRLAHLLQHGDEAPPATPAPEKEQPAVPTLAEFEAEFLEGYARANRQKHSSVVTKQSVFRVHLVPQLGAKRLDEISTADVQALKASLAAAAPKTVNNVLSILATALRVAREWGRVPASSPAPVVELVTVPEAEMLFYEPAEYERLVEASAKVGARAQLAVLLAGDAGLRQGEVVALEWGDVDLGRRRITVRRGEWRSVVSTTKGARPRIVPLTPRLEAALRGGRHLRGDRVLYRDDGRTVSARALRSWVERAERLAGMSRETGAMHVLRHTFGARLAIAGASPKAIQELMGHRNLSTTMRYMHLSPAARESAIALLAGPVGRDESEEFGKGRATSGVETSPKRRTT